MNPRFRLQLRRWAYRLIDRRPPDFVVGGHAAPYLRRWWVIPRNPIFNIYLHQVLRSDDDRALHDHPWPSLTWMLAGTYIEVTFLRPRQWRDDGSLVRTRRYAGDVVARRASTAHRLEIDPHGYAVTLFFTGPALRKWGFYCPDGWRYWREFVGERDRGVVGKGCA